MRDLFPKEHSYWLISNIYSGILEFCFYEPIKHCRILRQPLLDDMLMWRYYSHFDDITITSLWILDDAHQVSVGFQSNLRLAHKSCRHDNCVFGFLRHNFGSWMVPQLPGYQIGQTSVWNKKNKDDWLRLFQPLYGLKLRLSQKIML